MALKLSECPPSLHAAIMRQLEREGRHLPTTIIRYAMAYRVAGQWQVGPETESYKLIAQQVIRMQNLNARAAYETAKGNPPAVMLKLTRTGTLTSATPSSPAPQPKKL